MNNKLKTFFVAIPTILSSASIIFFAIYVWSAYHSRGHEMFMVCLVPLFSIYGIVVSILTRKAGRDNHVLWLIGLISSIICLALFMLLYCATWFALAQD